MLRQFPPWNFSFKQHDIHVIATIVRLKLIEFSMDTFHFHSSNTVSLITLNENDVECNIRRNFSKWHYKTPYSLLIPTPIRKCTTPSGFWACLLVGSGGFVASFVRIVKLDLSMPFQMAIPMLPVSLMVLAHSYRIRREEWISIPTIAPEFWINYCRNGRDSDEFELFTERLIAKINNSTSQTNAV